ncbi:MAG TPA: c-type cytochrome [Planctomycetota bacterium]|nr:c-type cytochrome [Planctomycetota bacterium]
MWLALLLAGAAPGEDPDRSPGDLALSPDGRWALTANRTSASVSLVDLTEGRVAAEVAVGRHPYGIDWKGGVAVVASLWDDSVAILEVAPPKIGVAATVRVGNEPRGVAISPDGTKAYIVVSGDNAVDVLDVAAKKVIRRVTVGAEPWFAALAGTWLLVGNAQSGDVSRINTATMEAAPPVQLEGHNLRRIAADPKGEAAYIAHIADRGSSVTLQNIERGLVIDNRISRVPVTGDGRASMGLDMKGFGAADPEGVAVSPEGTRLAVTLGGTRDLLLMSLPLPFPAEAGEFIPDALLKDKTRYRRVSGLRGRPLGCAFTPDGKSVVVANALGNEVQIVDWELGDVVRSIPLGGPKELTPARQGEKIFYDAARSWHDWFSCATCHAEGHTNGGVYDTLNDGRYGNPKKTLSLRGVTKTGPWTWHGQQQDLKQALQGSFTRTMSKPKLNPQEMSAVVAFLETNDFLPPPRDVPADAVARGGILFKEKLCDVCHIPPAYTSEDVMKVGLEAPDDVYKRGYNPPPLRGVWKRGPWLHDGRAKTLESVFQEHHRPSKLNSKPDFSPAELTDLLAFLKSL